MSGSPVKVLARHPLLLLGIAFTTALVLGGTTLALVSDREPITSRIVPGMTPAEVQTVLGGPPTWRIDWRTNPCMENPDDPFVRDQPGRMPRVQVMETWSMADGSPLDVHYIRGRVVGSRLRQATPRREDYLVKARHFLHLD